MTTTSPLPPRYSATTAILITIAMALVAISSCGRVVHNDQWKQADLDRNRLNHVVHGPVSAHQIVADRDGDRVVSATGSMEGYGDGGDLRIVIAYPDGELMSSEDDSYVCYEFTSPDGYSVDFSETGCPDDLPGPEEEWTWKPES